MFTHPEIWSFASAWYQLLDIHAPLECFRPLLTDDVQLVFPEATVTGFDGYAEWYNKVVNIFFDEVHTLKVADIESVDDDECTVHVVVNWQASVWDPPAATSTRLMMDADQTWRIRRLDDRLVVVQYVVNGMTYMPGSCKL
ncbi:hypothetical protein [Cyanobium sp. CH-040]|uniref:hypothetical protein n=1 Tax=Cyanobium sp. CH-040 TaxID=2823708 RepID=UPI0020CC7BCE|nr:hypothetical protein [Cyanobium sp. CH-040]MCP9927036.1 nuclear transport factor 2 family protein [Cyanobium sp. CH-040]